MLFFPGVDVVVAGLDDIRVRLAEEAALLESFGVDYFQGFHFGQPVLDPEWTRS